MNKFYIYPGNYSGLIKEGLIRRGNWVEEENKATAFVNCNFIWKPTNLSIAGYIKLDGIVRNRPKGFIQVFNHFENIRGICTKTGLVRSLKKYYQRNKEAEKADYTVFDSTPTSFIITAGSDDREHALFLSRFREIEKGNFSKEKVPQKHCLENFWLVKPANLNQGRGIKVFKSIKDIHAFLNEKTQHSFWVIQKYIERPLLYYGRKFDIRVWAIFTGKNEIFVYKKAYIRTSSDSFDLDSKNNYVHLTNNCLQQFGDNYGKHEDGNTLPLEMLDPYFEKAFPGKNVKLETHVMPRIKDLIIDTFLCTKADLNPNHRPNVFEFFGYDFLIDEDLRTWLIEVNTNPYLGTPNEYIGKLLPNMVDDMLDIATDHLFAAKSDFRNGRPNEFELIYCEANSRFHDGPLNVRSPITKNIYPEPDMIPPDTAKKIAAVEKKQETSQFKPSSTFTNKLSNSEGPNNLKLSGTPAQMKNQSVVLPEKTSPEKKDGEKEDSGDESSDEAASPSKRENRQRSSEEKSKKKVNKSTIEVIFKNLHLASIYKTNLNPNTLAKELKIVLSCLKNWELISEKRSSLACQTLKLFAQSSANFLLVDSNTVGVFADLLKSSNVRIDIKLAIVESMQFIAKEIPLKKKLICTKLVHELIRICVSSCDEKEIQNYNKQLLIIALKCLISLGGPFFKRASNLLEAKEFEKIKSSYMAQGALIAVWLVANHSLDPEMKEIALRTFLIFIDYKSMEKQLQILELLKIIPEAGSENEDSETEEPNKIAQNSTSKHRAEEKKENLPDEIIEKKIGKELEAELSIIHYEGIMRNEGDFASHADKLSSLKNDLTEKEVKGLVSFPKSLLKIYGLERLLEEFKDFLRCMKDVQYNKENDEKEKRIMIENEKQKKDDQRKQQQIEEAKRLHSNKVEKRSKSKQKLQQLQQMYLKYKDMSTLKFKDPLEKPRIFQTPKSQNQPRGLSNEQRKRENGRFFEDDAEKIAIEPENSSVSRSQINTIDGNSKSSKTNVKNTREPKTFRVVSKTGGTSVPTLVAKYSIAPSSNSTLLSQSQEINSDGENGTSQTLLANPSSFRNQLTGISRNSEKRLRTNVEENEAKVLQGEMLFAQELEKLQTKHSQKQLKPLPANHSDSEAKEQLRERKDYQINSSSSKSIRQASQNSKRKESTPTIIKRLNH